MPTIRIIIIVLFSIIAFVISILLLGPTNCTFGVGAACSSHTNSETPPIPAIPSTKYNFAIILTDDQRYDTVQYMENTSSYFANAVNFTNAFASTPYCCPARSSFLSGGMYPWEIHVMSNNLPNGGAGAFQDSNTLASLLQRSGYYTCMVGKYLNAYDVVAPHIFAGWSYFAETDIGGGNYTTYKITKGSSGPDAGSTGTLTSVTNGQFLTHYQRDEAINCLNNAKAAGKPWFLYLAFDAPHSPYYGAPEDANKFTNFNFTSPGTQETDLTDKPSWIQNQANTTHFDEDSGNARQIYRDQLRSLQAADRDVNDVLTKIDTLGFLGNTMIVYTSDNGFMWGEHGGFIGKTRPYEESIRIPLLIKFPGMVGQKRTELVAWNLDVPATILQLVGSNRYTEGTSLVPLITNKPTIWRDHLILQEFGFDKPQIPGTWAMYRDSEWAYVEYISPSGKNRIKELYNIAADPYELQNLANDVSYDSKMASFSTLIDQHRGISVTRSSLPSAKLGAPYSQQINAWGVVQPITCKLDSGEMPAGLTLGSDCLISGTPTSSRGYGINFEVTVTDSSSLPLSGNHQVYTTKYSISLSP